MQTDIYFADTYFFVIGPSPMSLAVLAAAVGLGIAWYLLFWRRGRGGRKADGRRERMSPVRKSCDGGTEEMSRTWDKPVG